MVLARAPAPHGTAGIAQGRGSRDGHLSDRAHACRASFRRRAAPCQDERRKLVPRHSERLGAQVHRGRGPGGPAAAFFEKLSTSCAWREQSLEKLRRSSRPRGCDEQGAAQRPPTRRLDCQLIEKNGRSERIRTSDPLVPNEVRYQAALHSDIWRGAPAAGEGPYSDAGKGGQGLRALRGADFPIPCRLVFLEKR